jgi:hypothetical protein
VDLVKKFKVDCSKGYNLDYLTFEACLFQVQYSADHLIAPVLSHFEEVLVLQLLDGLPDFPGPDNLAIIPFLHLGIAFSG